MVEVSELAIIISYPTSTSGIIVFLKTPDKISRILPEFSCKNNRFSACFYFEQTGVVAMFGEHGIMAHISQSEL